MHLRAATIVCRESSGRGAFGSVARLITSLLQARHLLRAKGNKRQTIKEITQSLIAYHRPSLLPYLALLNGVLGVDFSATAASAIVEGPQRTERVYAMLCVVLDNLLRTPARRADNSRLNLTMLVINVRSTAVVCRELHKRMSRILCEGEHTHTHTYTQTLCVRAKRKHIIHKRSITTRLLHRVTDTTQPTPRPHSTPIER